MAPPLGRGGVKLALNGSFPYQGKVAREARRKGSQPSLSVFTALTQMTVKTPPSRQTEPPPLRRGGVSRGAFMTYM